MRGDRHSKQAGVGILISVAVVGVGSKQSVVRWATGRVQQWAVQLGPMNKTAAASWPAWANYCTLTRISSVDKLAVSSGSFQRKIQRWDSTGGILDVGLGGAGA